MPTTKINRLDYKFILSIIVYAVIIAISWATSQSSIGINKDSTIVNSKGIIANEVDIKELQTKSVTSEINTNELYIRMEYMIDLQKEMNETLKAIKK